MSTGIGRTALLALIAVLAAVGSAFAVVVADRGSGFSATQGQNGWYYMYELYDKNDPTKNTYVPARAVLMTTYTASPRKWESPRRPDDGIAMIWSPDMYPNALQCHTNQVNSWYWPVSRWVSSVSGNVTIRGHVNEINQGVDPEKHTNGEIVWIYVDGVLKQTLPVNANDFVGYDYSFDTVLDVGSKVDWVQDPIGPGPMAPGEQPSWLIVRVEGTVEAFDGSIQGNITLEDFPSPPADLTLSPVRIEVVGGVTYQTVLTSNPGTYTIALAPGTYDLVFSASKFLRKVVTGLVVTLGGTTPCNVTLASGDFDGDNAITSADLNISLKNLDARGDP